MARNTERLTAMDTQPAPVAEGNVIQFPLSNDRNSAHRGELIRICGPEPGADFHHHMPIIELKWPENFLWLTYARSKAVAAMKVGQDIEATNILLANSPVYGSHRFRVRRQTACFIFKLTHNVECLVDGETLRGTEYDDCEHTVVAQDFIDTYTRLERMYPRED